MVRNDVKRFEDIPNVGKATARDFLLLGIRQPQDLVGKNAYKMYDELCRYTASTHDPCMIDVFISAIRYMEGGPLKKWWEFSKERKETLESIA